ncbi:hypothetical protein AcW1_003412 [Taiwanofungus camphoratus]|nr:hypothetical protein AcV5_002143 [Antrodia cinnamomea]KAI0941540.1 hypothetical protein AcW1_003412 [Antrodia cinnamomea]KAI0943989.1 hypothetical protein AcV7_001928 [Antrodia cinnamomea]
MVVILYTDMVETIQGMLSSHSTISYPPTPILASAAARSLGAAEIPIQCACAVPLLPCPSPAATAADWPSGLCHDGPRYGSAHGDVRILGLRSRGRGRPSSPQAAGHRLQTISSKRIPLHCAQVSRSLVVLFPLLSPLTSPSHKIRDPELNPMHCARSI